MKRLVQILDVDYFLKDGRPIIRIFGKQESGQALCGFYEGFKPYFYVEKNDATAMKLKELRLAHEEVQRKLPFGYQTSATTVYKVTLENPQDVPRIRATLELLGRCYEADVLFKYRFMVDHGLRGMSWVELDGEPRGTTRSKVPAFEVKSLLPVQKIGNAPLRNLCIDIECLQSDVSRAPDAKRDPIIAVGLAFLPTYRNQQSLVLLAKPASCADAVQCFRGERELLEALLHIIEEFDPDVITGYNINGFDMPYLLDRLKKFGLSAAMGRCDKPVVSKTFGGNQETEITGRVAADVYQLLKRDVSVRLHRYNLDTAARALIGQEKVNIKHTEIPAIWAKDVARFVEYTRKDALLAIQLLLERRMMDKFIEIAKISGPLLQDCLRGQTVRIETMVLHEFGKRGLIMPGKPSDTEATKRTEEKIKGGAVLEPKRGLHVDTVLVLDFQSLYPSIIKTFNVSVDALILGDSASSSPNGEVKYNTAPNGARFVDSTVYEGVFPTLIKNLLAARLEAKRAMKSASGDERRVLDAKQYALKILANSFYGYCGYARARLFRSEVANAITSYGRENIERTKAFVEKTFDAKVIYGDSLTAERFVTVRDPNGSVRIKNIEELFLEGQNRTTLGEKESSEPEGWCALAVDPVSMEPGWFPIKRAIRHRASKKIYRVGQKFGETRVTEDHSLITEQNGALVETKPTELPGKRMVRVAKLPAIPEVAHIDLYEWLRPYTVKSIYKGRQKVAAVHADGGELAFGWTSRKQPIRVKRLISTGTPEMAALCRLIGAYIAEGSSSTPETTTTRIGASIASSDVTWLKQLRKDYEMLFGNARTCIVRSSTGMRNLSYAGPRGAKHISYEDTTHKLQMMNKISAVFFKMLCGQKSSGKFIPEFIFHLPEKYRRIVLENMVRGDGSRKFANRRLGYSETYLAKNFRYETKSLRLASGFTLLLTQLEIDHEIRHRPAKQTYIITTTDKFDSNTPTRLSEEEYDGCVYDLEVEGSHMFVDSCGQILLHNTDSLFIKVATSDLNEAQRIGEQVAAAASKQIGLNLEFEKIYRSFLILTKKRYAGWKFERKGNEWEDALDMRGIETIRRDWCPLVGEAMLDVLNIILKERDIRKATQHVKRILKELSAGQVPVEKLTIVKGITRSLDAYDGIQPHVELAKKMQRRDPMNSPKVGDRVGFVVTRGKDILSKRAEDPEYAKQMGMQLDADYYVNSQLLPPVERIFEALGVEKGELMGAGKQVSIFETIGQPALACTSCGRTWRRLPLSGLCECGGSLK